MDKKFLNDCSLLITKYVRDSMRNMYKYNSCEGIQVAFKK